MGRVAVSLVLVAVAAACLALIVNIAATLSRLNEPLTTTIQPQPLPIRTVYVPRQIPDFPQLAHPTIERVDAGRPDWRPLTGGSLLGVWWDIDAPWRSLAIIDVSEGESVVYSLGDDCSEGRPCCWIIDEWQLVTISTNSVTIRHIASGHDQQLTLDGSDPEITAEKDLKAIAPQNTFFSWKRYGGYEDLR